MLTAELIKEIEKIGFHHLKSKKILDFWRFRNGRSSIYIYPDRSIELRRETGEFAESDATSGKIRSVLKKVHKLGL